ncbi:MAG: sulfatase activating formylglycine-generating enzyme [Bacillariaceae sp.]|jgi:formylglycine-generating enzyme required for sulfatase activity
MKIRRVVPIFVVASASYLLAVLTLCRQFRLVPAKAEIVTTDDDNKDEDDEWGTNLEDHPDPNDENYDGMIYVGKHDDISGRRISFDQDNGIRYIFGTSFDDNGRIHKDIAEKDLEHHPLRPVHDIPEHERKEVLKQRRHPGTVNANMADGETTTTTPKAFGAVEEHPLDGGVVPPKVVHVDPYFLDATLITNKEFGKFVRATYYETEVCVCMCSVFFFCDSSRLCRCREALSYPAYVTLLIG